jgi:ribose transport system substrate-binding protein
MMKRSFAVVLVLVMAVLFLTGGESFAADADKKYRVAVLTWSMAEEFGVDVVKGAQGAADKHGIEMMYPDPAGDMQKEIAIIEDLIQQKIDAVLIAPVDAEAVVPYIGKLREAGIIVVDYDIETKAECDAYIMSDHYNGGRKTGEEFLKKHPNKGKVLIVDDVPGVTTAELRNKGFEDYIKEHAPEVEIIHQLSTGTRDTHRATIENMIMAHPDLTGIFCFMGDIAIPAYFVLQSNDRQDIVLAGYDATPEQVEIMKNAGPDCNLVVSVALYPKNIGRVSMETAYDLLEGKAKPGIRVETVNGLLTPSNAATFEDLEVAQ